eukprot:590324-Rhodomonas_salina.2
MERLLGLCGGDGGSWGDGGSGGGSCEVVLTTSRGGPTVVCMLAVQMGCPDLQPDERIVGGGVGVVKAGFLGGGLAFLSPPCIEFRLLFPFPATMFATPPTAFFTTQAAPPTPATATIAAPV